MPRLKTKPTSKSRADDLSRVSADLRTSRSAILERQADVELIMGHIGIAERLARLAADLRSATA